MTKIEAKDPSLGAQRSVYVTLKWGKIERVEVALETVATYRSRPVVAKWTFKKYQASGGMTDFSGYVRGEHYDTYYATGEEVSFHNREGLTEVARRAVMDATKDVAYAWLETPEFSAKFAESLSYSIVRELKDSLPRVEDVVSAIDRYRDVIGDEFYDLITEAISLYRQFDKACDAVSDFKVSL